MTVGYIDNIEENSSIYIDLIKEFRDNGHEVFVVHSLEKRKNRDTCYEYKDNVHFLRVKTGNITKSSILEKGLATLLIEKQFIMAIKKYFQNEKFDLVLYSTPPITFYRIIKYIKQRDNATTYLLLKDIFPQNAVDLDMMSKSSFLYKYFRKKEKQLYKLSDFIGCMTPKNMEYIIDHNNIAQEKIEVCPNSIKINKNIVTNNNDMLKSKYDIPVEKTIFLYGGNLGKPQGIDFLLKCVKENEKNEESFFLIIGSGTEYNKVKMYFEENKIKNSKLLEFLPRHEYEAIVDICDVGLIFLDYRFTIPNFPSRLLSYMSKKKPVIAATDNVTDLKDEIRKGKFGYWCESNNVNKFMSYVSLMLNPIERKKKGINGFNYLKENYSVENTYQIIMKHFVN